MCPCVGDQGVRMVDLIPTLNFHNKNEYQDSPKRTPHGKPISSSFAIQRKDLTELSHIGHRWNFTVAPLTDELIDFSQNGQDSGRETFKSLGWLGERQRRAWKWCWAVAETRLSFLCSQNRLMGFTVFFPVLIIIKELRICIPNAHFSKVCCHPCRLRVVLNAAFPLGRCPHTPYMGLTYSLSALLMDLLKKKFPWEPILIALFLKSESFEVRWVRKWTSNWIPTHRATESQMCHFSVCSKFAF